MFCCFKLLVTHGHKYVLVFVSPNNFPDFTLIFLCGFVCRVQRGWCGGRGPTASQLRQARPAPGPW